MTSISRIYGISGLCPKTIVRQHSVQVSGKGTVVVKDLREGKKPISRRERELIRQKQVRGQVWYAQNKYNQRREKELARKALKNAAQELKCRNFLFGYIRKLMLSDYEAFRDTQFCVTKCGFYYQVILPNGNITYMKLSPESRGPEEYFVCHNYDQLRKLSRGCPPQKMFLLTRKEVYAMNDTGMFFEVES